MLRLRRTDRAWLVALAAPLQTEQLVIHKRRIGEQCVIDCLQCRLDDAATTQPASPRLAGHHDVGDVNCRQSSSGHVTSLIETLQPPPPPLSPSRSAASSRVTSGRSLIDAVHAQTSAALGVGAAARKSTLTDAVLGGVDLSLTAVVFGASNTSSSSQSPAVTSPALRRQPALRVTTEGPANHGPETGARPASGIGRRSAGVPHGSHRAFQQQQQQPQQASRRAGGQQHNTLLVVPPSWSTSRSASSSPSMPLASARGGSVSTSPSSASPSPSPEPISRHPSSASRSLSTQRPLGVTRTPSVGVSDDHAKPSRSCIQRHYDERQMTGGQTSRAEELHEQETFV